MPGNYINLAKDKMDLVVTKNVPNLVLVGEDTLHKHVKEFEEHLKTSSSHAKSLTGGLSFLLSTVAALSSASSWNDVLGVPSNVIHAVFLLVFVGSFVFSVWHLVQLCISKKKIMSVDCVVDKIMQEHKSDTRYSISATSAFK